MFAQGRASLAITALLRPQQALGPTSPRLWKRVLKRGVSTVWITR
jgi:hypothetical protein